MEQVSSHNKEYYYTLEYVLLVCYQRYITINETQSETHLVPQLLKIVPQYNYFSKTIQKYLVKIKYGAESYRPPPQPPPQGTSHRAREVSRANRSHKTLEGVLLGFYHNGRPRCRRLRCNFVKSEPVASRLRQNPSQCNGSEFNTEQLCPLQFLGYISGLSKK